MNSSRARTTRLIRLLGALVAVVLVVTAASPADASSARKKKHRKPAYAISESVSRSSAVPGTVVTVTGHVAPKAKGKRVTLQRRLGSGGWVSVAHKTLPRSSSYAMSLRLSAAGSYGLRTVVPKSRKRRAGVSAVRSVQVALPGWRSVSGGSYHSCGLKNDGSLWCWGSNRYGQLGSATNVGTTTVTPKPQRVGTGTAWVSVTTGQFHSCALRSDHTAWCWGENNAGQLGNTTNSGTATPNRVPLQVGGGGSWAGISAGGGTHSCGVKLDHTAWCWGFDHDGELGDGNSGSSSAHPTPVQVGAAHTWTQISVGFLHTCGRQSDGTAWCWGIGSAGRLGNGTTTSPVTTPVQVGTSTAWVSVASGDDGSCGIQNDHTAWCWGGNYYGQDGSTTNNGNSTGVLSPAKVGTATDWSVLSRGSSHTCGRKVDGTLWCWGANNHGQLGSSTNSGTATANPAPLQVAGSARWNQTDTGDLQTCAVRSDASAWCWGYNVNGQLGNPTNSGTTTANPAPLRVG